MDKPKLIIAGPGSGKTHGLVKEIANCIGNLEPYRILAAITYTNAATNSIKARLEKKIKIPPNIFIGTTYSFFNSFILMPFASIFSIAGMDKIFIEHDIIERAREITNKANLPNNKAKIMYQSKVQKNILDSLLKKGIIPFDQIARISCELIIKKRVRYLVGNKIQYLFIDEFQDATTHQYAIFEELRKEKRTTIYTVGDPEQYISNHTIKGRKIPDFRNIPIMSFQAKSEVQKHTQNKRSSEQIVNFINNFNTQIKQVSSAGKVEDSSVTFISETLHEKIIEKFQVITAPISKEVGFIRYYLAFANNEYDCVREKFGLSTISNDSLKPKSKLSEALQIISSATGLSGKKICSEYSLTIIEYRIMGIRVISNVFDSADKLKHFLITELKLKLDKDADFDILVKRLALIHGNKIAPINSSELTSSIHKAKGMEADAVLVLAKTNNELAKWLETDQAKRFDDKTDQLRLGFVAFSRAKKILCIACLQKLNPQNEAKLKSLGVTLT